MSTDFALAVSAQSVIRDCHAAKRRPNGRGGDDDRHRLPPPTTPARGQRCLALAPVSLTYQPEEKMRLDVARFTAQDKAMSLFDAAVRRGQHRQ